MSRGPKFGFELVVLIVCAIGLGVIIFFSLNNKDLPESCSVNQQLDSTVVITDGTKFDAEIAQTGEQKATGLSNRNCIDSDRTMLFPYSLTGDYCFWMKDMNFPIDMIWLDDDKKLVTVESDVAPDTYPQKFCPDKPAKYILEFASGTAQRYDWQPGQQFDFAL